MRDGYGRLVIGDVIVGMNGKPVRKEADLFGAPAARLAVPHCLFLLLPYCQVVELSRWQAPFSQVIGMPCF